MPLLRAQKEELVNRLISELQDCRVSIIFAYTGLNMLANDSLRTEAFTVGAKVKMISNNLLRLILRGVNREIEIPSKQLAIAYGFRDEVEAAKVLVEFARKTETLEVLGGWIDGNFFDTAQVKTLATLPTKVTLQTQLAGRLSAMTGSLAYALNFPIQKLAYVIEAVRSVQPGADLSDEFSVTSVEAKDEASAELLPRSAEAEKEEVTETSEDVEPVDGKISK